jgi:Diacylglycerol kinase N-terminus
LKLFCLPPTQDIDYEGFKLFMETYLEVEMQDELCRRLFLSFVKRTPTKTLSNVEGKVIKVTALLVHRIVAKFQQSSIFWLAASIYRFIRLGGCCGCSLSEEPAYPDGSICW